MPLKHRFNVKQNSYASTRCPGVPCAKLASSWVGYDLGLRVSPPAGSCSGLSCSCGCRPHCVRMWRQPPPPNAPAITATVKCVPCTTCGRRLTEPHRLHYLQGLQRRRRVRAAVPPIRWEPWQRRW